MTDPDYLPLDEGAVLGVDARTRNLLRVLATTIPTRCHHLGVGHQAIACAEHPAAGLLCDMCIEDHLSRHTGEVERRCDECGTVAPEGDRVMRIIVAQPPVSLITQDTAGEAAIYIGRLRVVCLGVCVPCGRRLGLPEEDA